MRYTALSGRIHCVVHDVAPGQESAVQGVLEGVGWTVPVAVTEREARQDGRGPAAEPEPETEVRQEPVGMLEHHLRLPLLAEPFDASQFPVVHNHPDRVGGAHGRCGGRSRGGGVS